MRRQLRCVADEGGCSTTRVSFVIPTSSHPNARSVLHGVASRSGQHDALAVVPPLVPHAVRKVRDLGAAEQLSVQRVHCRRGGVSLSVNGRAEGGARMQTHCLGRCGTRGLTGARPALSRTTPCWTASPPTSRSAARLPGPAASPPHLLSRSPARSPATAPAESQRRDKRDNTNGGPVQNAAKALTQVHGTHLEVFDAVRHRGARLHLGAGAGRVRQRGRGL